MIREMIMERLSLSIHRLCKRYYSYIVHSVISKLRDAVCMYCMYAFHGIIARRKARGYNARIRKERQWKKTANARLPPVLLRGSKKIIHVKMNAQSTRPSKPQSKELMTEKTKKTREKRKSKSVISIVPA